VEAASAGSHRLGVVVAEELRRLFTWEERHRRLLARLIRERPELRSFTFRLEERPRSTRAREARPAGDCTYSRIA
jgi:hypothetical protein